MTTFFLARHGQTDWNVEGRVQGHTDVPLNDAGREQAHALAESLAGESFDAVYSSDLLRAHETARIVADRHGLDVTVVPDLREKHFGTWEGLYDTEVLERFPHAHQGPWGDAETSDELSRRVIGALERLATAHPDGRVLVVTHGGCLRAVLRHCETSDEGPIANCHVVRIASEEGNLRSVH